MLSGSYAEAFLAALPADVAEIGEEAFCGDSGLDIVTPWYLEAAAEGTADPTGSLLVRWNRKANANRYKGNDINETYRGLGDNLYSVLLSLMK